MPVQVRLAVPIKEQARMSCFFIGDFLWRPRERNATITLYEAYARSECFAGGFCPADYFDCISGDDNCLDGCRDCGEFYLDLA